MAGAIHGLELVIGFFDFDRAEHTVFVKVGVAAGVNEVVAAFEQFFTQPIFDDLSNQPALGMPENQAWAGFFLNAEEVELGAQLAMIAALGFLDAMQMRVQLFLREESHGIDSLELGIAFPALPVGAGDVHQLERLNALGRGNMRAAAEVDEFSSGIEGNHRLGGFFLDQFAFENLVGLFVEVQRFRLGNEFALVGQVLRRELAHLLFDFGEVFLGERLLAQEFVEEAGVDWRTDTEFHVWKEFHNRSREQVCGGMAKYK